MQIANQENGSFAFPPKYEVHSDDNGLSHVGEAAVYGAEVAEGWRVYARFFPDRELRNTPNSSLGETHLSGMDTQEAMAGARAWVEADGVAITGGELQQEAAAPGYNRVFHGFLTVARVVETPQERAA